MVLSIKQMSTKLTTFPNYRLSFVADNISSCLKMRWLQICILYDLVRGEGGGIPLKTKQQLTLVWMASNQTSCLFHSEILKREFFFLMKLDWRCSSSHSHKITNYNHYPSKHTHTWMFLLAQVDILLHIIWCNKTRHSHQDHLILSW